MYRGTTPSHVFHVNTDLRDASVLFITYKQNNQVVLEKTLEDCQIGEEEIRVSLSQEETLGFKAGVGVDIQIRAGFSDGRRIASNIITTNAKKILKDGVI